MRPEAAHAREVVLELGELDLELALGAAGVRGEDVEDHRRAVDDRQAELLLEVALLARGELVVAGDQVRVALLGVRGELDELARPEIGVRVRALAMLDELADDGDAGRAQELAQLGEVLAGRERRDAHGALARAGSRGLVDVERLGLACPRIHDGANAVGPGAGGSGGRRTEGATIRPGSVVLPDTNDGGGL